MNLKLIELSIENFKGVEKFTIKPRGKNIVIRGKNGTGKSTIADAYFWLLTNQNSDLRASFNIIPVDENSRPVNHTQPTVTAILQNDQKKIQLKKVYRQVWTKRRGAEEQELTGHTTDYFFDEVPVSKKEYEKRLTKVCDPDLFRSISDVHYFCAATKPEYRRQALLDLSGKLFDEEIMKKFDDLAELPDILNGRTIDDYKAVLRQRKKAVNKQLDEIPVRIDEVRNSRPDVKGLTAESIQTEIMEADKALSEKRTALADLENGVAIAEKRRMIADLKAEASAAVDTIDQKHRAKLAGFANKLDKIAAETAKKKRELTELTDDIANIGYAVNDNIKARKKAQDEYRQAKNKRQFNRTTCPTCGQDLPPEKIAEAEASFNVEKAESLRKINEYGKHLLTTHTQLEARLSECNKQVEFVKQQLEQLNTDAEMVEIEIRNENERLASLKAAGTKEIDDRIATLHKDLFTENEAIGPDKDRINEEIVQIETARGIAESNALKLTQAEKVDRRVADLEKLLKEHGREYESIHHHLYLIELFTRKRAQFIEESVSKYFTITQWRLFEEQINGAFKEICEAACNGVPYSTDLNTGARINVGIDVINTFSLHHCRFFPVFVDNAESVTEMIETQSQLIRLVADAGVDGLEVVND